MILNFEVGGHLLKTDVQLHLFNMSVKYVFLCLPVTDSEHILEVIKLRSSKESKSFTCRSIEGRIAESNKL